MLNRRIQATFAHARQLAHQFTAWTSLSNGIYIKTTHHAQMIFCVAAMAVLSLMLSVMLFKSQITHHSQESSNEQNIVNVANAENIKNITNDAASNALTRAKLTTHAAEKLNLFNDKTKTPIHAQKQQQWVSEWLAKRYKVANEAINMFVSTTYLTAKEMKLDPLLILAVMAIESGFNPYAESPVGAQGLMQVMSKIHHEKFQEVGGINSALNPIANIKVGSLILKDYVTRNGSIEGGLKSYVGAAAFDSDSGYGSRVLAEYRRLKEVAMGKKVPVFSSPSNSGMQKLRPMPIPTPIDSSREQKPAIIIESALPKLNEQTG